MFIINKNMTNKITTTRDFLDLIEKKSNLNDFLNYFKRDIKNDVCDEGNLWDGYSLEKIVELSVLFQCTNLEEKLQKHFEKKIKKIYICFGKDSTFNCINESNIDLNKYLTTKPFRSGSSGGIIDIKIKITFEDKSNFYLCGSGKYYKKITGEDNEKDITKYDIQDIFMTVNYKEIKKNYKGCIFINDKDMLEKKIKNNKNGERRKKIIDFITLNNELLVYDIKEIDIWYRRLRTILQKNNNLNKRIKYITNINNYNYLKLRPHQYIIVKRYIELIKKTNEILINAVPRCGKTYILGGIIKKLYKRVLWITPRPTSCSEGYEKMINQYSDFTEYKKLVSYKGDKDNIKKKDYKEDKYIHLVSRHLILDKQNTDNRGLKIEYKKYDIVVIDEAHLCMNDESLKKINQILKTTKVLYLTGTSENVEEKRNLQEEQIIRYSYRDVMTFKNGNIYNVLEKYYPKIMKEYLKENNLVTDIDIINEYVIKEEIQKPYKKYPDLQMIHVEMNEKEYTYDQEYGFNLTKLFAMTEDKSKLKLESNVVNIFNKIFGFNNMSSKSLLESIDLYETECIHLVFLPCGGTGSNLKKLQDNIKKLLEKKKNFNDNFEIMNVNSEEMNKEVVKSVEDRFKEVKGKGKSLVVLLGEMLVVGCSIPDAYTCSILCEETNIYKQNTIQKIFRCLTEKDDNTKDTGYVFMFQPKEEDSLQCLWNIIKKDDESIEKQIEWILKNEMFRILRDDFTFKDFKYNELRTLFIDMNGRYFNENDKIRLDKSKMTKEEINLFVKNKSIVLIKNYEDDREINEKYKNVKKYEKINTGEKGEKRVKEILEQIKEGIKDIGDIDVTFTKLINMLLVFCPLNTIYNNFRDAIVNEMIINEILFKSLKETYKVNLNLCVEKKEDMIIAIDFILGLVNDNKLKSNDIIKFRFEGFQEKKQKLKYNYLYRNMKELLEKLLKPTEREKKQRGEVLTPYNLAKEMILLLQKYGNDVFKNPFLKWFDPANGNGIFIVVIFELLVEDNSGLKMYRNKEGKRIVKNKKGESFDLGILEDRRKWVLEEMIYVSELDPLNCMMYENVFNPEGKYKMNIYCGDSLKLNIKEKWGIEKFDIIVGNPPYNNKKTNNKKKIVKN